MATICGQVQELVAAGEPLPEKAQEHLGHCLTCQRVAQRWSAARREFSRWRHDPLPPFLHLRIMAAVRQTAPPPVPWWRRMPRAAWASAGLATVLAGVLATQGVLYLRKDEPSVVDHLAEGKARPDAEEVVAQHLPLPEERPMAKAAARPAEETTRVRSAGPGSAAPAPLDPVGEGEKARQRRELSGQGREAIAAAPVLPAITAPPPAAAGEAQERAIAAADSVGGALAPEKEWEHAAATRQRTAPAHQLRAQEAAAIAQPPTKGAVALVAASGEQAWTLLLDAAAAPPSTAVWVVVIHPDGQVALEGPPADALAVLTPAWQRALAGAELPPGRYRAAAAWR